jgi:hypothetical protein
LIYAWHTANNTAGIISSADANVFEEVIWNEVEIVEIAW